MATIPIPSGLADGQVAFAGHVTPLYNEINGQLNDTNMVTGGVDGKVLKTATVNGNTLINTTLDLNNKSSAGTITSGSVVIGAGGPDVVTAHGRGRLPILGVSAGTVGSATALYVNKLEAVTTTNFTVGQDLLASLDGVGNNGTGGDGSVFFTHF